MHIARSFALSLVFLAALCALAAPARLPRQLPADDDLQPLDDATSDDQTREKRKLEGVTEAKFGIKNAVLGFVFGKINSLIDSKTRLVETLDKKNIELNKQYGIEAPKDGGLASLSGIVGQVIGPKLQLLGPKIQAVSGLLGGASGGSGGSEWRYVEPPGEPAAEHGHAHLEHGHAHLEHGHAHLERTRAAPGDAQAHRRHPGVRPQQGQPGRAGEPVWAVRVAPHPYY